MEPGIIKTNNRQRMTNFIIWMVVTLTSLISLSNLRTKERITKAQVTIPINLEEIASPKEIDNVIKLANQFVVPSFAIEMLIKL